MALDYVTVDVFTAKAYSGNPLAVVLDARGLMTAEMQAVAREFNYAETAFVLPPGNVANTANVRIFTPGREVPFAGHPNVGTAYVLARQGKVFGRPVGDRLMLEEKAGLVAVEVLREAGAIVGATITAPEPLSLGRAFEPASVAAAVGLDEADILTSSHRPQVASVGLGFLIVELASLQALARVRVRMEPFARLLPADGADAIHLYVRAGLDAPVRARMFSPLDGTNEDPATGSANGALAALLAHLDPRPALGLALTVHQGVEMGRPSEIGVTVAKRDGRLSGVRISGRVVHVMSGRIETRPGAWP